MTDPVVAPVPPAEVPQIRPAPDAPRRSEAIDQDLWTAKAEARLAAEPLVHADMNALALFANRCAEVANEGAQAALLAGDSAEVAASAADQAATSALTAEIAAAAAGAAAGLPSMVGKAEMALTVNSDESGVAWREVSAAPFNDTTALAQIQASALCF